MSIPTSPTGHALVIKRVLWLITGAGTLLAWFLQSCAPVPQFVTPDQVSGRIPTQWMNEPVICLLDSELYEFVPDDGANRLVSTQTRVLQVNKRNPPLLQELEFFDYESLEDRPKVEVEIRYPDGKILRPKISGENRKNVVPNGEYASSLWRQSYRIPHYVAGMRITIRERRNYLLTAMITHSYLRTEYSTLARRIRFESPPGSKVKAGLQNRERLALESFRYDSAGIILSVQGKNLEKINFTNAPKHPEDWYAGVHFSLASVGNQIPGWKEVGDHYLGLIESNLQVNDSVRTFASKLPGGEAESVMREAFAAVVGRVRYLANEDKMYSWIPRSPGYVLENGFGDCKEMSNLLRALLQEKGLDAGLALVYSGHGFQVVKDFPGLGNFNHCIAYVRLSGDSIRFLDPTITFSDAANSYLHLAGQKALVLGKGTSQLVEIRLAPDQVSRVVTNSNLVGPASDGAWEMKGAVVLSGPISMRWIVRTRYSSPESSRHWLQGELKDALGLESQSCGVDSVSPGRIKISYRCRMDGKVLPRGKGGILLDIPSPISATALGPKPEGSVEFPALEQLDEWILPEGYSQMEQNPFEFPDAKGIWEREGIVVRRRFQASALHFEAGDTVSLSKYRAQLSRFTPAVVWKP